jgi:CheY-like chemotaxis protein
MCIIGLPTASRPAQEQLMPEHDIVGRGTPDFPDLSGLTFLVVDDHADSLDVAVQLLQACGATVATATSGAEALERLDGQIPDVIVTDLRMPVMDGVELLQRIRARPHISNVPVIALSAFHEKYMDGVSAFDRFFQKPLDIDALGGAVLKLTAGR